MFQRQLAELRDEIGQPRPGPQMGAAPQFAQLVVAREIVLQAAGVREQVFDGDGPFERLQVWRVLGAAGPDFHLL